MGARGHGRWEAQHRNKPGRLRRAQNKRCVAILSRSQTRVTADRKWEDGLGMERTVWPGRFVSSSFCPGVLERISGTLSGLQGVRASVRLSLRGGVEAIPRCRFGGQGTLLPRLFAGVRVFRRQTACAGAQTPKVNW